MAAAAQHSVKSRWSVHAVCCAGGCIHRRARQGRPAGSDEQNLSVDDVNQGYATSLTRSIQSICVNGLDCAAFCNCQAVLSCTAVMFRMARQPRLWFAQTHTLPLDTTQPLPTRTAIIRIVAKSHLEQKVAWLNALGNSSVKSCTCTMYLWYL
jgi:hypothetical protein